MKSSIGQIAKVGAGQSAPQDESAFSNVGTPFVRAGSLEFLCRGVNVNKLERIDGQQAKKHRMKLYPAGTILFAKSGMSAVQNRVFVLPKPAHVVSHLATIEVKNGVDPQFLAYFWKNFKTSRLIQDPAYPSISLEAVNDVEIQLPGEDEQKRIAAILDKADRLRRQRRFAQTFSDSFLQSVFNKALHGGGDSKQKSLKEVLIESPKNGFYLPADKYGTGTPIIRINNFYSGTLSAPYTFKRLRASTREIEEFGVANGDVLINRVNSLEYLGKCALVAGLKEKTVYESNMMRLRVEKDKILPIWLVTYLSSIKANEQIQKCAKKAVNQASINQKDVESFMIPVPPLPLQEKFAAIVQKFERIRRQQREATRQAEHLFQTLLHRAFRGHL